MIVEELNPIQHAAGIVGSKLKVYWAEGRFIIEVYGFSDTIAKILDQILAKIKDIEITRELFNRVRSLPTIKTRPDQPYSQACELLNRLLYKTFYTSSDQMEDILKIQFEEFTGGLISVLGDGLVLESLIEGNLTVDDAIKMQQSVANSFGIKQPEQSISTVGVGVGVLKLDEDIRIARRSLTRTDKNGAVVVNIQTGWLAASVDDTDRSDLENVGYLSVVAQIVDQRFFDSLRTKQQLGYIVRACKYFQGLRTGLMFMVQSQAPTAIVEERIMEFINQIPEIIVALSEDDFKKYVRVVLNELNSQPTSLSDAFLVDWVEIKRRRFDFERHSRLIATVETLNKDRLVEYVIEQIIRAPKAIATIAGSGESNFTDILTQEELLKLKSDPQAQWVYSNTNPIRILDRTIV
jgi:secreted Zn-dependent insulinase-like peptidase